MFGTQEGKQYTVLLHRHRNENSILFYFTGTEHVRYPGTNTIPTQNMFSIQKRKQYRHKTCSVPRNENSTGTEHVWYPGMKTVPAQNMFGTQERKQYRHRTCLVPRNENSTGTEHVWYPGTKTVPAQNMFGTQE